jgi:predicted RND superfamily exporter protein
MTWARAVIVTLLSAVLFSALFTLRFDMRPHAALPDRSTDARAFAKLASVLQKHELALFMVEGGRDTADLLTTTDLVAARVSALPVVEAVAHKAAKDEAAQLFSVAYPLLTANAREAFEKRLTSEGIRERARSLRARAELPGGSALMTRALADPLGLGELMTSSVAAGQIDFSTGYVLVGSPAVACVFVKAKRPASDNETARALFDTALALQKEFGSKGFTVNATGAHVFAAEYQARLQNGLALSGAVSISLVILVGLLLFRDLGALLSIGAALGIAAGWTLGAASLIFGELQILAVSAASILPAVGIDAGVQAFAALREAPEGDSFAARLRHAFTTVRRPIATAALAALLGFLAFTTAEVRAFRQFGALLALGVVANTIAMFTVLPLGFAIGGRLFPGWPRDKKEQRLVERFGAWLGRVPQQVLLIASVALVVVLFVVGRSPEHAFGFSALVDKSFVGARGQAVFERAFGASARHAFVLIEAKDRDSALAAQRVLHKRLGEEKAITVEGFALSEPTAADRQTARAIFAARPAEVIARELAAALDAEGFDPSAFASGLERLSLLRADTSALPGFTRFFAERAAYEDGTALVSFFVRDGDVDSAIARVRSAIGSVLLQDTKVELAGPVLVDRELERLLPKDAVQLTLLALLGVIAALLIARIGWREGLVAICSLLLVFTSLWYLLGLLHVRLTLVTVLVFPFVLGIGVDATVYLVSHPAYRRSPSELLATHLRPLLASTLTTLAGFSALLAVPLAEIQALGIAVVAGLCLSLFFALVWVVAFATNVVGPAPDK